MNPQSRRFTALRLPFRHSSALYATQDLLSRLLLNAGSRALGLSVFLCWKYPQRTICVSGNRTRVSASKGRVLPLDDHLLHLIVVITTYSVLDCGPLVEFQPLSKLGVSWSCVEQFTFRCPSLAASCRSHPTP